MVLACGATGLAQVSGSAAPGWWPESVAVPNLLLQKVPAREFTVTTLVDASSLLKGERSGLLMMGRDYSYLAVERAGNAVLRVVRISCVDAPKSSRESETGIIEVKAQRVFLQAHVDEKGECQFSYSIDGERFDEFGQRFIAEPGMWIGAKVGLFALGDRGATAHGYSDFDWVRIK